MEEEARLEYERQEEENRKRLEQTRQRFLDDQEARRIKMERGRNVDALKNHWERQDRLRG